MADRRNDGGRGTLFGGPGAIEALCRSIDWSETPLGPVQGWPPSLRVAVRLCLDARTMMAIWAGPDFTLIYNEPYQAVLGDKHPGAMGRSAREVWSEVWPEVGAEFRAIFEGGAPIRREDVRLRIQRGGGADEAYFTYATTPIREEDGSIVGLLVMIEEATRAIRQRAQLESFLTFALASAGIGAWELDEEARSPRHNLEHDRIFGYEEPVPEWSYDRFLDHVLPEDREAVDREFWDAVASRSSWSFECRIRRCDGEVRWIAAMGRHFKGSGDAGWRLAGIVQDITARRTAEEELQRSQARHVFLLRLNDVLRPLADPVGIQVTAARLLREHLDASNVHYGLVEADGDHVVIARDEAHGAPDFGGRFALSAFPAFYRAAQEGSTFVLDDASTDPRLGAEERDRYVPAAVVVPLVKEGRFAAMLGVHRDHPHPWTADEVALIEETAERTWEAVSRARTEQALRASEAQFRRTMENMLEGCAILGFDWTYLFANKANADQARVPLEALLGRRLQEVFPGVEQTPFFEAYRRCMEERTPQRTEAEFTLPDGASVWFETVAEPVAEGILVRSQDITARKREEQAMREGRALLDQQRARLQAIVDTIPVGLFVMERDGQLSITNDEARRVWAGAVPLDRIEDYAQYKAFWPQTGEQLKAEEWAAAQALLHGVQTKEQVVDIERFDGTRGTIVISGAPIRDDQGQVAGAVVAMQDISELRDAQMRLEEADRRKDHFLAVLSHELRNPLAPIKSGLYVLGRVPEGSDPAQRARAVIERQVEQLSHLVDDLLDFTRITRGRIELRRHRLALDALVERTLEDHRALLEEARLDVRLELPSEQLFIHADEHRIAQVMSNLLQNAVKYTPPAGRVTVSVEAEPAEGRAVLRVSDTGRGISEELLGRLFEPFSQADRSLDRSEGGLGLGLALVKELVEQHGGTVEARSGGLGRGAEFTVRLPLAPAEVVEVEAEEADGGAQRRVLVIEDNVDAADTLKELLQLEGHEVAVAYDGPGGIARAREFHPDLVLCDIGLPGMDGYAVARRFRGDDALREAHLVALTGYALPEDQQRAAEAGFERHLAKPPSLEALWEVLRELR